MLRRSSILVLATAVVGGAVLWQNLINFGVLPLIFDNEDDYEIIAAGEKLILENLSGVSASNKDIELKLGSGGTLRLRHNLSNRQVEVLRVGGLINQTSQSKGARGSGARTTV